MATPFQLRLLTSDDLPAADELRALSGWNQTPQDWERFLAMAPDACFAAEAGGRVVGTATTTEYGVELAWIGMVLVHPEHRRHGIGRALLERCLDFLRQRGIRCIKLDATPAGRLVYEGLGFRDEWTLSRWERDGCAGAAEARCAAGAEPVACLRDGDRSGELRVRSWRASDEPAICGLDSAAFGGARDGLLSRLAAQSRDAVVCEQGSGQLAGYGLIRDGARARYLGPVVANSADVGLALTDELLRRNGQCQVYWDFPDSNTAAVRWARAHGFREQRTLIRMFLGTNAAPGDPAKVFGLAGPEVG